MKKERCPYCHEYVAIDQFENHCKAHQKLRSDGQQMDYVTLPSEERSDQSLEGIPQIYVHKKCGKMTRMPEEIIRSYLVNPYLYLTDTTFCSGCKKQVPEKECYWVETGENMQKSTNRLRAAKPEHRPNLLTRLYYLIYCQRWIK